MSLNRKSLGWLAIVFLAGLAVGRVLPSAPVAHAQGDRRVFELRTYTAPEGKLPELQARFRNHTMRIFNKHNMTSIGYWVPQDAPNSQKKNWADFQADSEWQKVSTESQVNGRIVSKVESVFMDPTDYSPIK